MNRLRSLVVVVIVAVWLEGCAVGVPYAYTGMTTATTPPSAEPRSYQPLNFKKWGSGLYADEFFGKAVIVDGYIMKNPSAGMGSINSEIRLHVSEYSLKQMQASAHRAYKDPIMMNQMVSSAVTVIAPLSMRDLVFNFENEQRVRVYGVVGSIYSSNVFTPQMVKGALLVRADRIEVVK